FSSRSVTAKTGGIVYPLPPFEPSLIFVQRGIIELFTICKRRPVAIRRVVSGDVFGDAPPFDMSMLGSRARAVTDCRFICVPTAVMVSAARASHHLSVKWWSTVTPSLTELREQVIAMKYASVRQQLAGLLLKLADNEGVVSGVDQLAIAGRLEVRRETVSSRLSKMKSEGIVSVSREMITILDRDRMREIAAFREEANHD
ncbi:MAG: Crp/Fnr family transcriptional regulator, partial [Blastocatellia bacterium]